MTTSTLLIESVQPEDAGDYYCIATSPRVVYNNVTSSVFKVHILSKQMKHDSGIFFGHSLHA